MNECKFKPGDRVEWNRDNDTILSGVLIGIASAPSKYASETFTAVDGGDGLIWTPLVSRLRHARPTPDTPLTPELIERMGLVYEFEKTGFSSSGDYFFRNRVDHACKTWGDVETLFRLLGEELPK